MRRDNTQPSVAASRLRVMDIGSGRPLQRWMVVESGAQQVMADPDTTDPKHREYTWKLCGLCQGVAHDPDPEGWGEPCDNCAGHGGKWVEAETDVEQS